MPRPLVIGNGNLLVALDANLSIRDFTYPYVGLLNHLSGHHIRIGVWISGRFAWMDDAGWRKSLRYVDDTLVTEARCRHDGLAIELTVSDCVLHRDNALLRKFTIVNLEPGEREARIFLSNNFHIAETDIGDTAFYNPFADAVVHYKRDVYFLIGGESGDEGIYQYTTGIKGFRGAEGTWRDAEDGLLAMHPVEQGSVDSTLSFRAVVPGGANAVIHSWTCVGKTLTEVTDLSKMIKLSGFDALRERTSGFWVSWSHNESEADRIARLPEPIANLFRRSLMVIRTQTDNRGAIIAANDSDIMETARAHYSYMWPRDGALVAAALDRLGYQDLTRRFFNFCKRVLPPDRPALMHKYSADGSWGATWHPWQGENHKEIPFQQDSTALVLWALARHYERNRDLEYLDTLYTSLIAPAADFIVTYRDPRTGLPLSSYDLWEERRGVHAFTCGTVYGALEAAARLADVFDDKRADHYRLAASEVQAGIRTHLWDANAGRFARRLIPKDDNGYERDMTIDSAVYALFAFGALPADDPMIEQTMRQTLSRLWVQTEVGGMARYAEDYYFRRSDDFNRVPGNPWIICTLWAAQYYIAHAKSVKELETALGLMTWVAAHATESGILSEQLHPLTGEPLSVSPLTWSHAEFVTTTLEYMDRQDQLATAEAAIADGA